MLFLKYSTKLRIKISINDTQPEKVSSYICLIPFPNFIEVNLEHPRKQQDPKWVTESGISISNKFKQPLKQDSSIFTIVFGI